MLNISLNNCCPMENICKTLYVFSILDKVYYPIYLFEEL